MQFNGLINTKPKSLLYSFLAASLVLASTFIAPSVSDAATINCSTASCLTSALSNAAAGDIIVLDATKTYTGNFVLSKDGTSSAPIVIKSSSTTSKPILDGGTTSTGYTLYITGNYVQLKDLKITNGKKGIMLDNSNNSLIDNVEVYNIGEEGVHFRDGSSNNTIQNSKIYNVGTLTPDYGEGVYIGSDYGKWGTYKKETDNNVVRNNIIGPDVRAESIDIKEGSTGAIIEGNTFNGTGISGANSADSFMDVKGNNNIIRNNTANRNNNSIIADAFQTNERQPGWGFNNDFYNNTVNMNTSSGYVVNVKAGSAKVCNNTRTPSGNMYTGAVTTYTSCGGGSTPTPTPTPTPNPNDSKWAVPAGSVTASTSDTNVPANTVDGSLSTRWSGSGDGAWIRFDLGSSKLVTFVKVAFYNGSTRTSTFDIQTSTDGTTWSTKASGLTNAANNNLQTFDIADTTARYVRLVGHGNNVNTWNSYTEVEIWGH